MHLCFSAYRLPWQMSRMSVHLHVGCEKSQFLHFKSNTMSSFLVDSGEGHRGTGITKVCEFPVRAVGVARNKLKICNSMTSGELLL